jgi:hypothetical protein
MAKANPHMQKLLDQRARLAADIEAMRNKLAGIDMAIATLRGNEPESGVSGSPRANVKGTMLSIINDAGKAGVTASEVVERANAMGRSLDRGSVSSLLSRFKREGLLSFDGARYFPAEPKEPTNVRPIKSVFA